MRASFSSRPYYYTDRAMADDSPQADESLSARAMQRGYRWLRFAEPLEQQYRQDHRANAHRFVRMSLIVARSIFRSTSRIT